MDSTGSDATGKFPDDLTPSELEGVFRRVKDSTLSHYRTSAVEDALRRLGSVDATQESIPPDLVHAMLRGVRRGRLRQLIGPSPLAVAVRAAAVVMIVGAGVSTASMRVHNIAPTRALGTSQALASQNRRAVASTTTTTTAAPLASTTTTTAVMPSHSVTTAPAKASVAPPVTLPIYQAPSTTSVPAPPPTIPSPVTTPTLPPSVAGYGTYSSGSSGCTPQDGVVSGTNCPPSGQVIMPSSSGDGASSSSPQNGTNSDGTVTSSAPPPSS